ncbi:E domain-containing protein [Staphylococcus epidermidis]
MKPGHKDEFDPNAPKGSQEDVPGKPGVKNPDTGEVVTTSDVTPVDEIRLRQRKKFRLIKNANLIQT